MLWAIRQLCIPLNYLRIKQGRGIFNSKIAYDFIIPSILTVGTVCLAVFMGSKLNLYSHETLTKSLSDLFALLIAFYMAALAAVSTFDREGIDSPLKGDPATLTILNHRSGLSEVRSLNYRQFIAYLFGYLSFSSLMLFLSLLFFRGSWHTLEAKLSGAAIIGTYFSFAKGYIDAIIFASFMFGLWQMFLTSLLGIYFLCDRIQSLQGSGD